MLTSRWVRCHKIISRHNWAHAKPLLLESIRNSDFVAFDYELTGLHQKNERYLGEDEAYIAHSEGVKAFIPVQLGICACKYNSDTLKWDLTPASIYVYPWMSGLEENAHFSVSTAALNFLVSNGFDLNKWILDGVSWLTPFQEMEARSTIKSRLDEISEMKAAAASKPAFSPMDIPDGPDKEMMSEVKKSIDAWLQTDSIVPLELLMESAFTRLLAHTYISHEFPSLFSHSVKRNDLRFLCVYKNRNDLFAEQIAELEKEMTKIDEKIGIREIFDEISNNSKPLVGHNCFYDLLHTWHSFYGMIPDSFGKFKREWLKRFRTTFDTKYIAEEILTCTENKTLRSLCDSLLESKKLDIRIVPLSPEFEYHLPTASATDHSHDAGYDAMMTGIVFVHQISHVMERKGLDRPPDNLASLLSSNRIRLVKTQPSSTHLV